MHIGTSECQFVQKYTQKSEVSKILNSEREKVLSHHGHRQWRSVLVSPIQRRVRVQRGPAATSDGVVLRCQHPPSATLPGSVTARALQHPQPATPAKLRRHLQVASLVQADPNWRKRSDIHAEVPNRHTNWKIHQKPGPPGKHKKNTKNR